MNTHLDERYRDHQGSQRARGAADKMVEYGIARSRSRAFNLTIEKGLRNAVKGVQRWENIYSKAGKLEKQKLS